MTGKQTLIWVNSRWLNGIEFHEISFNKTGIHLFVYKQGLNQGVSVEPLVVEKLCGLSRL